MFLSVRNFPSSLIIYDLQCKMSTYTIVMKLAKVGRELSHIDYWFSSPLVHSVTFYFPYLSSGTSFFPDKKPCPWLWWRYMGENKCTLFSAYQNWAIANGAVSYQIHWIKNSSLHVFSSVKNYMNMTILKESLPGPLSHGYHLLATHLC